MPRREPIVDGDVVRIPLTRGLFVTVDLIDADLGESNWFAIQADRGGGWYAARNQARPGRGFIHLHRVIAERAGLAIDGLEVDHRDGNGLNCRRLNIRAATKSQNQCNRRRQTNNTSGHKGVYRHRDKWRARIRFGGKTYSLGVFDSLEEAASAYAVKAVVLHGEFVRLT